MKMKNAIGVAGIVAAFLSAGAARAADDWSGAYLGLQLGSARSVTDYADKNDFWDNQEQNGISDTERSKGFYLGYARQKRSFLYGVEVETLRLDNNDRSEMGCTGCTPIPYQQTTIKSLQTLKVRAGVVVDNAMIYLGAGPARAAVDFMSDDTGWTGGTPHPYAVGRWYFGMAYAVGVETTLSPHLVARLQSETVNFRQHTHGDNDKNTRFGDTTSVTNLSVGLAYKF